MADDDPTVEDKPSHDTEIVLAAINQSHRLLVGKILEVSARLESVFGARLDALSMRVTKVEADLADLKAALEAERKGTP